MCKCTPGIKTPFCGKRGCEPPILCGIPPDNQNVSSSKERVSDEWLEQRIESADQLTRLALQELRDLRATLPPPELPEKLPVDVMVHHTRFMAGVSTGLVLGCIERFAKHAVTKVEHSPNCMSMYSKPLTGEEYECTCTAGEKPACEHDLQKPNHTVWVSDCGKVARCSACGQQWSPFARSADETSERQWLIRKRGYYYRPDRAGYTANVAEAGRYTEEEAKQEAAIEPSIMQAIHVSQL